MRFRDAPWFSAFYTCVDCFWYDMSKLSTHLNNMSIKSQIMDALSQRVHNVDTFSAKSCGHMADLPAASACAIHADRSRNAAQAGAEELDAVIRQNLEVLGYGE